MTLEEGYDSDIITPIATHDEKTPRDPYRMELLKPLRSCFRFSEIKKALDIGNPEVEKAIMHLRNIVISAEMGLDPKGLEPDPGSQAIVMAGLMTKIFKKGNELKATSSIKDFIKDISKGKTTFLSYYNTFMFVRFVTVSKKKYLNFINA